jgi:NAD(P)-dependent dehydrogenase (short-subunit alcohol dehydrogenase family)
MDPFAGNVAVVTGAASGIGRAIAQRCADEGMQVVLADIDQHGVDQAAQEIGRTGAHVIAVRTDVSDADAVESLAARSFERFGAVHLLCNNAGGASVGTLWESSVADRKRVLDVNLWGVIHGVRSFVPRILAQGAASRIVNTASVTGLFVPSVLGAYTVSKHAVVALSEVLRAQLEQRCANIRVSVPYPNPVNTRFAEDAAVRDDLPGLDAEIEAIRGPMERGLSPGDVADGLFAGLREDAFYVLSSAGVKVPIQRRMEGILNGYVPS